MQHKFKFNIALAIACAAAAAAISISVYFTFEHRKRRTKKPHKIPCYLHTQSKPQNSFKRVLADNSFSPFKHLTLIPSSIHAKPSNSHPFETEIITLLNNPQIDYTLFHELSMIEMGESYVWVQSELQLREIAGLLSKEKVFAVDTEQHSLRSFLGFTALVQISTKKEDYLIDTIALHGVMDLLRPVFADPSILKVFHGADNDILWLQRDFHIYVVNLFDTAKACEVLSKPQKSLAYLLETYCDVITNKLLQREDWRQRPLPEEMVEYARLDAHYLLYISSCLIDELKVKDNDISVSKNSACQDNKSHFLLEASRRSNTSCLQLYVKEDEGFPGESAASSILSRNLSGQRVASEKFSGAQFQNHVGRLCAWRDLMARVHDESLRYILSDQAIVALADRCPTSEREIYHTIAHSGQNCDSPASSVLMSPSPAVCSHWEDILCLLKYGESTSDDILQTILQKRLGPDGTCSLSIYNYNLLSWCNWKLEKRSLSLQNGIKNGKHAGRKASRELFVQKFSCKAPVYHNCRIFASDSRLLCYCDRKKLDWYLSRNLAKLVDDDPPAIILLFEPKGRPEDEDNDFYIQSKRNMCVGCGERNHYLRYRIIPSCYRMHFPEHLKSHRSHDIILLCVDCHEIAHAAAEKYKRQVAVEFGIPLFVRRVTAPGHGQRTKTPELIEQMEGVSPLQLRTAVMALLRHGQRMPSKRREELIEIVKMYYGGRDISHEDLEATLVIGMSSNERRKFEKKGLFNKHFEATFFPNKVQENTDNASRTVKHHSSESSKISGSLDAKDQESSELLSNKVETHVVKPFVSSELEVKSASTSESTSQAFGFNGISEIRDVNLSNAENKFEDLNPPNGIVTPSVSNSDGEKCNKVSLLGHGPHGKEVVAHLLKNYGEDGIHQFCQRWRQVFVDAVNPRYLPGGWDIKHSGRRDFGEFSVYNPGKKNAGAVEGG